MKPMRGCDDKATTSNWSCPAAAGLGPSHPQFITPQQFLESLKHCMTAGAIKSRTFTCRSTGPPPLGLTSFQAKLYILLGLSFETQAAAARVERLRCGSMIC